MASSSAALRVASRFLQKQGMEHSSPDELKKYLRDHPNADPKNHSVKKDEGGGPSGGGNAEWSKAEARSKEITKTFEDMKSLGKKVENADPAAKKKFDKAYTKLLDGGDTAAKAAEKLLKKHNGASGEAEHAVELLHRAVKDWDQNRVDHKKTESHFDSRKKLQQAEQTWAYAKQIDDRIKMLGDALKGE